MSNKDLRLVNNSRLYQVNSQPLFYYLVEFFCINISIPPKTFGAKNFVVIGFECFCKGPELTHSLVIDVPVVLSYEHGYVHNEAPNLSILTPAVFCPALENPHYPYNSPMVTGRSEFLIEAGVNVFEYINRAVLNWILSSRQRHLLLFLIFLPEDGLLFGCQY